MTGARVIRPESAAQLAEALKALAQARRTIRLGGHFTKDRLGGPCLDSDETISTSALNRLLKYEPNDLTVSVEAGMPWRELERTLAEYGQMLPLEPPFEDATVGGVIAANQSGPLRRLFGTARDMVIGMTFVTLDGQEIRTGGNVVKNVAGLDMGKLMIGSFGTLAGIASANFKVFPIPPASRTFVMEFATAAEAFARRRGVTHDLTHVLIGAARSLNIPARYIAGYCCGGSGTAQDSGHAWAEAYVDGLGWIGFDVVNCICPTDAYVRVAVGLDALGAAPVRGTRVGLGEETLAVAIRVDQ